MGIARVGMLRVVPVVALVLGRGCGLHLGCVVLVYVSLLVLKLYQLIVVLIVLSRSLGLLITSLALLGAMLSLLLLRGWLGINLNRYRLRRDVLSVALIILHLISDL